MHSPTPTHGSYWREQAGYLGSVRFKDHTNFIMPCASSGEAKYSSIKKMRSLQIMTILAAALERVIVLCCLTDSSH